MKTIKILAFSLMATSGMLITSCGDDDSGTKLPPIGGYNSADEIGTADLIAYWPLNGDGKENVSGTMPSSSPNVTYSAGIKGDGATLAQGFLKYPSIASLSNSLTSFSISTWAKVSNNGASGSVFLSLTRPGEWAGNVNFLSETGWAQATSDSLTVKGQIVSNNALGWQDSRNTIKLDQNQMDENANNGPNDTDHVAYANKVGGQWFHAVLTWDGTTRMFKVYVNGVKISNPKWEDRGAADSPALAFTTPTFPVIGAFGTTANGTATESWDKAMTGQLDEMRVWKKALSQAEIGSLYELEKAGR